MKTTFIENASKYASFIEESTCKGIEYQVSLSASRWSKVGEVDTKGRVIRSPRCYNVGRMSLTAYFTEPQDAVDFANAIRKVIIKHFEKVGGYNTTCASHRIGRYFTEPKKHDYTFAEVLPYLWGVSCCLIDWEED